MTGSRSDTREEATRPISVAELLAKNGTIGSPPVTGRRRRRRGNSGAVTVAELTGEIPIIRAGDTEDRHGLHGEHGDDGEDGEDSVAAPPVERDEYRPVTMPTRSEPVERVEKIGWDEPSPRWPKSPVQSRSGPGLERGYDPRPVRRSVPTEPHAEPAAHRIGAGSLDYPDDDVAAADAGYADDDADAADYDYDSDYDAEYDAGYAEDAEDADYDGDYDADYDAEYDADADYDEDDGPARRSFLRRPGRLFGRRADHWDADEDFDHADDGRVDAEDGDAEVAFGESAPSGSRRVEVLGYTATVLESVLAVTFGAGVFYAFGLLWRWNNIVALLLTILITVGLAVAVRVVRRTEDILSTLAAVTVGLFITLAPLVMHA